MKSLKQKYDYWKERCLACEECWANTGEPSSVQPKEYYEIKIKISENYERLKSKEHLYET